MIGEQTLHLQASVHHIYPSVRLVHTSCIHQMMTSSCCPAGAQQQLPDLSARQESKLRQLTVASLARTMKVIFGTYRCWGQGMRVMKRASYLYREGASCGGLSSCIHDGLVRMVGTGTYKH